MTIRNSNRYQYGVSSIELILTLGVAASIIFGIFVLAHKIRAENIKYSEYDDQKSYINNYKVSINLSVQYENKLYTGGGF